MDFLNNPDVGYDENSYSDPENDDENLKELLNEISLELEILMEKIARGHECDIDLVEQLKKEYKEISSKLSIHSSAVALLTPISNSNLSPDASNEIVNNDILELETETSNEDDTEELFNEIKMEIEIMREKIQRGVPIDENRYNHLLEAQASHPRFILQLNIDRANWKQSIAEYCQNCLWTMRSFIPPDISKVKLEDLETLGVPTEVARRVLKKQCLWLTRMSHEEISKLHEVDLNTRFSISGQLLDVVEIAAIYSCLPNEFTHDPHMKKAEWRRGVEDTLWSNLKDMESDALPQARVRAAAYCTGTTTMGPIQDRHSVRNNSISGKFECDSGRRRKSFKEVCAEHSLLSKSRNSSGGTLA